MRFLRSALIITVVTGPLQARPDNDSIMHFANRDQVAGQLQAMTTDSLMWTSGAFVEPAPFDVDQVLELTLPTSYEPRNTDHVAVVTLKNEDTVRGQLVSITEHDIVLDTWFAGLMSFNRPMVSSIKIEGQSKHHYHGPNKIENWIQSDDPPAWRYQRFAFISNNRGSIARKDILQDQCSVSFTAEWKSDSIALNVILFSDDPKNERSSSGYELSFQRTSIYLRSGKRRNFLGSANSPELGQSDKVHVEIRASKKTGRVILLLNGITANIWNDPNLDETPFGSCLHFVANNSQPMRISNIKVAPWDGKNDQLPRSQINQRQSNHLIPHHDPEVDGDNRMKLANGDRIEGEVTAIENNTISLSTALGDFKIPIERFRDLVLPGLDLERCKRNKGDIRASFPDGTSLVFRLDEVNGNTITGSSQNFGTAVFDLSSIRRIEFNLYIQKFNELRTIRNW